MHFVTATVSSACAIMIPSAHAANDSPVWREEKKEEKKQKPHMGGKVQKGEQK